MFTPAQLASELERPRYADALSRFRAAAEHGGQRDDADEHGVAIKLGHALFSRYYPTDELQTLLNTLPADASEAAMYVKPPEPYEGADIGRRLDVAEVLALPEFLRAVLTNLVAKPLDLGNGDVLADVVALLAESPKSLARVRDAANSTPCTPVEYIGARRDVATHNDVLAALGVA